MVGVAKNRGKTSARNRVPTLVKKEARTASVHHFLVHLCKTEGERAKERRSLSSVISGCREEREGASTCVILTTAKYTPPLNLYLRVKQ